MQIQKKCYGSNSATKSDIASLKPEVDEIEIDELKSISADLWKLSNVSNVNKKTTYEKFVTKVNALGRKILCTSGLVSKTHYYSEKQNLQKKIENLDAKIPNASELIKKNSLNTKITEVKNKILSIIGLVITHTLNARIREIENKMRSTSSLVKNADYN